MGFGTRSCMVFCYLNAACAVFISYLFKIGINSMAIVSVINKWDRQEKAQACRNAGILYLVVAIAMTVKDMVDTRRERRMRGDAGQRVADYGMSWEAVRHGEAVPLLDHRAFVARDDDGARGASHGYGGTSA